MKKQWWHNKVAYQIYPKSFNDSNDDGIGDIPGIIQKLDYLKDLGIDIIWISPFYCSPLADQGYDISDYYNIDPVFGTMDDFDDLLAETARRDMHVVLDLVVNHCSDEHEWFKKACQDPDGRYGKYFYIEDWHEGEPLPCNWRSYFGGPVWDLLPGHTDKIYLHVFHKKQPDLNWENPEVREDVYKMINWWLDKGVSGFRIDAIMNIKKKLPFYNMPADREDGMCATSKMLEEAEGVDIFLNEMADRTFKPHNAFSVGEVFNEKPDALPSIIGDDGYFSSMFDFAETILNKTDEGWYTQQPVTPEQYKEACFGSQKRAGNIGFLSNIIENHDEPRGVSHYIPEGDCCDASKKMLGGLNYMLRGLPFIYQGQELGMENVNFQDISQINDISTLDEYQVALDAGLSPEKALKVVSHFSRDNARTPIPWDDSENGGFTKGTPWLMMNPTFKEINAASQVGVEGSMFEWYKELIALRKNPAYEDALIYGETVPYLPEQKNLMAYIRKGENQKVLVIGNFQREPQTMVLPGTVKSVLMNNLDQLSQTGDTLQLEGYQFVILELN
ncbi:MAG: alpha-glucosidase [Lachnospiraceae bacterium]|nr:alpha-glucosidase [Lachnospiraceae bacterium]